MITLIRIRVSTFPERNGVPAHVSCQTESYDGSILVSSDVVTSENFSCNGVTLQDGEYQVWHDGSYTGFNVKAGQQFINCFSAELIQNTVYELRRI